MRTIGKVRSKVPRKVSMQLLTAAPGTKREWLGMACATRKPRVFRRDLPTRDHIGVKWSARWGTPGVVGATRDRSNLTLISLVARWPRHCVTNVRSARQARGGAEC